MTGAITAFASNFFFSQGPWTPWQMMAYGIAGFLAGLLFHRRRPFPGKPWLSAAVLAVYGFGTDVKRREGHTHIRIEFVTISEDAEE